MQIKNVVREAAQIQAVAANICDWKGKSTSNVATSTSQSVAANATHATNRLKSFFSKLGTPHDASNKSVRKPEITTESELIDPLSKVSATVCLSVDLHYLLMLPFLTMSLDLP